MPYSLTIGRKMDFLPPQRVMGILNLTPDSFFAKSRCSGSSQAAIVDEALKRVEAMLAEGLDILDLGAVSTRPGSEAPSQKEEWQRLCGVLDAVVKRFPNLVVSIDTFRAEIAQGCVEHGAHIINDVSGGTFDKEMLSTVGRLQVPYVLMHTLGKPDHMQDRPHYEDVTTDLIRFFSTRLALARKAGIADVIIDPGFGFGKTTAHNYQLLAELSRFKILDCPILVGLSRKSMLYKPLEIDAEQALNATTCANTLALAQGADILRVHDVKAAAEAIRLFNLYSHYREAK